MNYQQILAEVKLDPANLKKLESEISNLSDDEIHQIYLSAVNAHWEALENIPEEKRTADICLVAVKRSAGWAYREIPKSVLNHDIYLELVKYAPKDAMAIIPEEQKNFDICKEAVTQDPESFPFVPKAMRNFEICSIAISQEPNRPGIALGLLEYINPFAEKTSMSSDEYNQLLSLAIQQDPLVLKLLAKEDIEKLDIKILEVGLQKNWRALQYIPPTMHKNDFYLSAIKACQKSLLDDWRECRYVPPTLYQEAFFLAAINRGREDACRNWLELRNIPEEFRDYKTCLTVVKQEIWALQDVPLKICTYEMLNEIIQNDKSSSYSYLILSKMKALQEMSKLNVSQYNAFCQDILKRDPDAFRFLDKSDRNLDNCLAAIKNNNDILKRIFNYKQETVLTHKEFIIVCKAVIKENGFFWVKDIIHDLRDLGTLSQDEYNSLLAEAFIHHVYDRNEIQALINVADNAYDIWSDLIKQGVSALQFVPQRIADYPMWEAAVKIDGLQLQYVPEDKRDIHLCREAIKQNKEATKFAPMQNLDDDYLVELVSKNWRVLGDVPADRRSYAMCEIAVKQNARALEFVPENIRSHLFTPDAYLKLLQDNADLLQYIPEKIRTQILTYEVSLQVVKRSGLMLQYVPESMRDSPLCIEAVKANGLAVQFVPATLRTYDLCTEAIKRNGFALEYVPDNLKNYDFYMEAVKLNSSALAYIQKFKKDLHITPDEYKALCIAAIQHDAMALQFVDEGMKNDIIRTITPEKILYMSYKALDYFPKDHPFETEINRFLAEIKHVVLTGSPLASDHETKDVYMVYANHQKRVGKIIHTVTSDAQQLFDAIQKAQKNNPQKINLTLIGHANVSSTSLAGMDVKDMSNFIDKNASINRLTLLGCKTAQVEKLEAEKLMINKFAAKNEASSNAGPCGLVVLSRKVDPTDYPKFLKKMDRTYILTKTMVDGKEQYDLTYLQKNTSNDGGYITKQYKLDKTDVMSLQKNILTEKGKHLAFPKSATEVLYHRGGATAKPLSDSELDKIHQAANKFGIFDKANPNYKDNKSEYVPMSSVTIKEDEAYKLSPVFDMILLSVNSEQIVDIKKIWDTNYEKPILIKCGDKVSLYGFTEDKWKETELDHKVFKDIPFPEAIGETKILDGNTLTKEMRADIESKNAHTQSLLERVYKGLKLNRDDVDIKAYTGIVSVDTKERRLLNTPNMIYAADYKVSTFFSTKDNIDRDVLDRERKHGVENMRKSEVKGKSEVKSVTIRARKHTSPKL